MLKGKINGIIFTASCKVLTVGEGLLIQKERRELLERYDEEHENEPELAMGLMNFPLVRYALSELTISGEPVELPLLQEVYLAIPETFIEKILEITFKLNPQYEAAFAQEVKKTLGSLILNLPSTLANKT